MRTSYLIQTSLAFFEEDGATQRDDHVRVVLEQGALRGVRQVNECVKALKKSDQKKSDLKFFLHFVAKVLDKWSYDYCVYL